MKNLTKFMSAKALRNLIYYLIVFIAGIFVANNWASEEMISQIIPGLAAIIFTILGITEAVENPEESEPTE